jgi:hypothetical protein
LEVPVLSLAHPAAADELLDCLLREVTKDIEASIQFGTAATCDKDIVKHASGPTDETSGRLEALLGRDGQFLMDLHTYPLQRGWTSVARASAVAGAANQEQLQEGLKEGQDGQSRKRRRNSCTGNHGPATAAAPPSALAGASALEEILAKDMQPVEDGIFTLPMLFFDEAAACCQVQSSADIWKEMLLSCGYRKQATAHLELYMDWSLLQQCTKPAAGLRSAADAGRKLLGTSAASAAGDRLTRFNQLEQAGGRAGAAALMPTHAERAPTGRRGSGGKRGSDGEGRAEEDEVCEGNWEAERQGLAMQSTGQAGSDDQQEGAEQGEDITRWITSQPILQKGLSKHPTAGVNSLMAEAWRGCRRTLAQLLGAAVVGSMYPTAEAAAGLNEAEVLPAAVAKVLGVNQTAKVRLAAGQGTAAAVLHGSCHGAALVEATPLQSAAVETAAAYAKKPAALGAEGGSPVAKNVAPSAQQEKTLHSAPSLASACAYKQAQGWASHSTAAAPTAAADGAPTAKKRAHDVISDMDYFVSLHNAPPVPYSCKRHKPVGLGVGLREDMAGVVPGGASGAAAGPVTEDRGASDPAAGQPAAAAPAVGGCERKEMCFNEGAPGGEVRATPDAAGHCVVQAPCAAKLASLHTLQLPANLLALIWKLRSSRDELLVAAGLGHTHLMTCELWDLEPVDTLLSSYSQAQEQQGPAEKAVIKALVSVLLLGQTALCLAHFGVRVGHLFLSQRLQQLPAIGKGCQGAAEVLAAADAAVADKTMEDHPKQTKLRQVLMSIDAMHPVSILLAGDVRMDRLCLCTSCSAHI